MTHSTATKLRDRPPRIEPDSLKRCGFVIRVSTDTQARNPEGSLVNQLQRLRAHVEYRNLAGDGTKWGEVDQYVLKGVSGKHSLRTPEMQRMLADLRSGRINTVMCTALDRLGRRVTDLLQFFETLNELGGEFVSLRENYDTTSPQGKLFVTVVAALAEFEREQTSARTADAMHARAERGLWNGSQIYGYDLDPAQKGTLIVNPHEAAVVNVAFDVYLETGSVLKTVDSLKRRGLRTKEYTSRRDRYHPPKPFSYGVVRWMLSNVAYVGIKPVNKKKRLTGGNSKPEDAYQEVEASWSGIVPDEKFRRAQELLTINDAANGNRAKPIRHTYVLNGGLLACGKCGQPMAGTCGTSRAKRRHYYYRCTNRKCRFGVRANEIEQVILDRLRELALEERTLAELVMATNAKLNEELPRIQRQIDESKRELDQVSGDASALTARLARMTAAKACDLVEQKLEELANRKSELEDRLAELEIAAGAARRDVIDAKQVAEALAKITEVFARLKPYEQKKLISLILKRAVLGEDTLELAFYAPNPGMVEEPPQERPGERFAPASNWLPKCASTRTIREPEICSRIVHTSYGESTGWEHPDLCAQIVVPGHGPLETHSIQPQLRDLREAPPLESGARRLKPGRSTSDAATLLRKALDWRDQLKTGVVSSRAEIARREGLSRARVTQVMGMLRLAPEIQQHILAMPAMIGRPSITERALRPIARLEDHTHQKGRFQELIEVE